MSMSINATGRVSTPTSDIAAATSATAAAATRTAAGTSSIEATFNSDLKDPAPRHFPWLSRLSSQLESAAPQKSPFPSAPMVGETLNQAA